MTPDSAQRIQSALSPARLRSYAPPLVACRDGESEVEAAVRLYQWHAELAAALWPVMHVFEVTVRNAISDAISVVHGTGWAHERSFLNKLPRAPRDRSTNKIVGYGPYEDLKTQSTKHPSTGKVIPELKMAFWEKMLTSRHDQDFWERHLYVAFPCLPQGRNQVHRNVLREKYENVRKIRNRLAHHESVADPSRFDIDGIFNDIMTVLNWHSISLHDWVSSFERVQEVNSQRP